MGLKLFGSSSRSESAKRGLLGAPLPGDPNPTRFEWVSLERFGEYCVAVVRWPDALNYEGLKVGVYRATPDELRGATRLDPHFQEQRGPLVPIARFEPTERGIELARFLAGKLYQGTVG